MDVISRILRPFRNRRRQINRVEVADVQGSFYHATESLADVHRFFADEKNLPEAVATDVRSIKGICFVCRQESSFRIQRDPMTGDVNWRESLNCSGCGLISRWRSNLHLFENLCLPVVEDRIYMTERITPLYREVARRFPGTVGSEFRPDAAPGGLLELPSGPIRNEDVTRLSFGDRSFEFVLSFDVLEHVPDYRRALGEFFRVLVRGGQLMFSVPFTFSEATETRAITNDDGQTEHLLEPVYHGDPLSEKGVLCYRSFGMEILKEMRAVGFNDSYLVCFSSQEWACYGANVMFVGCKVSV